MVGPNHADPIVHTRATHAPTHAPSDRTKPTMAAAQTKQADAGISPDATVGLIGALVGAGIGALVSVLAVYLSSRQLFFKTAFLQDSTGESKPQIAVRALRMPSHWCRRNRS